MKIILDAGHALIGAVGAHANGMKEEVEARKIVALLKKKLENQGHTVIIASCDEEANANKQLQKIVAIANKHKNADLFVSVHMNAFANESANGVETFSYSKSGNGHTYATDVQEELVRLGYTDRGKKEAGFYVLKHTICPAILVECGFITSPKDNKLHNVENIAEAILKGITHVSSGPSVIFRVVAGSYSQKKNAEDMKKLLESKGIKSFIDVINK